MNEVIGDACTRVRRDAALALIAFAAIAGLSALWPHTLLDAADRAAYAVCHRLPDHTIWIAGRPLPLCARCTGMYLGALACLLALQISGRGRAAAFPARRYWLVLGLFVALWAFDGLNSYLTLFPIFPHLYEPQNLLRLATGALQGIVLSVILLPVVNATLWQHPDPRPVLEGGRRLLGLILSIVAVVALVQSQLTVLLYPLALLSGSAVIVMVGAVNAVVLLSVLRRDGQATSWRPLWSPLLLALALALGELTAIGLLRAAITESFGLPF